MTDCNLVGSVVLSESSTIMRGPFLTSEQSVSSKWHKTRRLQCPLHHDRINNSYISDNFLTTSSHRKICLSNFTRLVGLTYQQTIGTKTYCLEKILLALIHLRTFDLLYPSLYMLNHNESKYA